MTWHHLTASLQRVLGDLAALVWPTECVCCGAPDRDCCEMCRASLPRGTFRTLQGFGVPCLVGGEYEDALAAVIIAMKHADRLRFVAPLAGVLLTPLEVALSLVPSAPGAGRSPPTLPPLLVTIPSRARRVRARGYRHVDLLAKRALRRVPRASVSRPRVAPALRTLPGRRSQVGLGPTERAQNAELVAVRRSWKRRVRGRSVVLIDDIITTGASVLAAKQVCETAGAQVIAIVALAAAERRDTRRDIEVAARLPSGVEFRKGVTVRRTGPPA